MLSESARASLLAELRYAPDEILVEATYRTQRYLKALSTLGLLTGEAPPLKTEAPAPKPSVENTQPPGTIVTRIGSDTLASVLAYCAEPRTADEITKHLGRGPSQLNNTLGVLLLMWSRKQLRYDGERYYV